MKHNIQKSFVLWDFFPFFQLTYTKLQQHSSDLYQVYILTAISFQLNLGGSETETNYQTINTITADQKRSQKGTRSKLEIFKQHINS